MAKFKFRKLICKLLHRKSKAKTSVIDRDTSSLHDTVSYKPVKALHSQCSEDIETLNTCCKTRLHRAVKTGFEPGVRLLLDNGAAVNTKDEEGSTCLHTALRNKNQSIVKILLSRGADLNATDGTGQTPLHVATAMNFISGIQSLLNRNAEVDATDTNASACCSFRSDCKVNVNARDNDGLTALHLAACIDSTLICQLLLENGAKVTVKNNNGCTPLHQALRNKNNNLVELMVNAFENINVVDRDGNSFLHHAVELDCLESARLLLNAGIDVDHKNSRGQVALHLAVRPSRDNRGEIIRLLLERSADMNIRDNKGRTPLHISCVGCAYTHVPCELLLAGGADVNVKDYVGFTPLHFATKKLNKKLVEALLESGASVNARDKKGDTPLHIAARSKSKFTPDVIKILLEKGAAVNTKDRQGQTSLHLVVQQHDYYCEEAVTSLLMWGGSAFTRDRNGNTPLDLALMLCRTKPFIEHFKNYPHPQRVLKLNLQSLPVNTLNIINEEWFKEIEKISSTKFGKDAHVSIISRHDRFICKIFREAVESKRLEREFPFFTSYLKDKFVTANKTFFEVAIRSIPLSAEILKFIFDFLSYKNMGIWWKRTHVTASNLMIVCCNKLTGYFVVYIRGI